MTHSGIDPVHLFMALAIGLAFVIVSAVAAITYATQRNLRR
jgi:hypothetical protein